jgi:D-alanyl-D-alanine carboxypeptidase/D-alanyl-D-alanine-endopeptidase (penicillin-binding protein 4)
MEALVRYRLGKQSASIAAALVLGATGAVSGGALALPQAPSGPTASVAGLPEDLDALLADPRLNGGHAGVVVRRANTGEVVYSRNGDKRFNPGSNEKLLSSAAALDILGLDYRFTTSVSFSGTRTAGTVSGNLYLKGTGDPTTSAAVYDALAVQVRAAGITRVNGGLIADDTWFDRVPLGTEWAWDDEPFAYAAQISALTVSASDIHDTGVVRVTSGPGAAAGSPAVVTLDPPSSGVTVVNQAVTGPAGSARSISVTREHGKNVILVTGSTPVGVPAPAPNLRTVDNPALYAASVFRAALFRRGVTVVKPGSTIGATPAGTTAVTSRQSMPLSQLLPAFLKVSNNGHAEILTKSIGRKVSNQGTWSAGLAATATFLNSVGVSASNLRMVEGAGLSRQDLVTPTEVTALLRGVQSRPWFTTWYNALPIAGAPGQLVGGTLENRMKNTAAANNVHAKTGTLTSVSALSGYVTNAAGEKLVFSVLTKDFLGAAPKSLEDSIAVTLANSGAAGAAAAAKRDVARMPKQRTLRNDPTTRVDESTLECSWVPAGC